MAIIMMMVMTTLWLCVGLFVDLFFGLLFMVIWGTNEWTSEQPQQCYEVISDSHLACRRRSCS